MLTDLRLWLRRHRKWHQCASEAVDGRVTLHCTRRRGHERYDPLHFNVWMQVAWRLEMVQKDYPSTAEACRMIALDSGKVESASGAVSDTDVSSPLADRTTDRIVADGAAYRAGSTAHQSAP